MPAMSASTSVSSGWEVCLERSGRVPGRGMRPGENEGEDEDEDEDEDLQAHERTTDMTAEPPDYETTTRTRTTTTAPQDVLPTYSCDVHLEGVLLRKMELEDTSRRAACRAWQPVRVVLHGTSFNMYRVEQERAWWGGRRQHGPGPAASGKTWPSLGDVSSSTSSSSSSLLLVKSYSLLHADVGIAADYRKRQHVIRMRAEADQFLLSCGEASSLLQWLDGLVAAINVAAPIDERQAPRHSSTPRRQRRRRRAHARARDGGGGSSNSISRALDARPVDTVTATATAHTALVHGDAYGTETRTEHAHEHTDKWLPKHGWTMMHDHGYARLCHAVLLFRSPRKSNYVIVGGARWFVDWTTGRMIRVLPPPYDGCWCAHAVPA